MVDVLLLEPNSVLAAQYGQALREMATIRICNNAQDAILQADAQTPDVVIVEPLLATHSGIEFIYEFKSYTEWRHVPLIILSRLTASELGIVPATQAELEILDVLYKPETKLKTLAEAVQKAITKKPSV